MSQSVTVYKVVQGVPETGLLSCTIKTSPYAQQYVIGEATQGHNGTPLFAFADAETAAKFAGVWAVLRLTVTAQPAAQLASLHIYEAQAVPYVGETPTALPLDTAVMTVAELDEFWQRMDTGVWLIPPGTVFCESITLVRRID